MRRVGTRDAPRRRRGRDTRATGGRQVGDTGATGGRHARAGRAPGSRRGRAWLARASRRASASRRSGGPREGIGEPAGVERQRLIPGAVERRVRQPLAEPMRARPRHPRGAGGARDAAGLDQRGEEDTLPGGRPLRAKRRDGGRRPRGRVGGAILFHRRGWIRTFPTLEGVVGQGEWPRLTIVRIVVHLFV